MSGISSLFAHHLDNHALRPLSVELRIVDLLPRSEVELAVRYGNNDFVVNDEAFEVRVAVRFARAVVAVIFAVRGQVFQPFIDVPNQSVFGIVLRRRPQ
jgi:hypothetical protein